MQLLLFLGAGVSTPSGLPTAADLTAQLLANRSAISQTESDAAPRQIYAADVSARIPRFLRLLKEYDEADIKRVGYTRASKHGNRYTSTTAIFRSGSTYEDIFFLCSQIKHWASGWSDHCMTTPLGFTVSEFEPAKLIGAALVDQARKHRKRSPDDMVRVQEQRKAGSHRR